MSPASAAPAPPTSSPAVTIRVARTGLFVSDRAEPLCPPPADEYGAFPGSCKRGSSSVLEPLVAWLQAQGAERSRSGALRLVAEPDISFAAFLDVSITLANQSITQAVAVERLPAGRLRFRAIVGHGDWQHVPWLAVKRSGSVERWGAQPHLQCGTWTAGVPVDVRECLRDVVTDVSPARVLVAVSLETPMQVVLDIAAALPDGAELGFIGI